MNSLVLNLALFTGLVSGSFYSPSTSTQKYLWESFKTEHAKRYATADEESFRFTVFVENLKLIDARNAQEQGTASHGITKFSDLTVDEFKRSHLNYVPRKYENVTFDDTIEPMAEGSTIVKDWTGILTTPVKDQGYCGSCWAFSATEQIESDFMRAGGAETILSPQQVNSCTPYLLPSAGGCNGGKTENAYKYAEGGLELDADYPYTSGAAGVTGTCKTSAALFVVKTTAYAQVSNSASGESAMATYVGATGPLSVCVDASQWSSYTGGILSTCGTTVDHCVQAVGIDTTAGYWKVRNSWGTSWGESGYIRLKYGANTCAIASDATYSTAVKY